MTERIPFDVLEELFKTKVTKITKGEEVKRLEIRIPAYLYDLLRKESFDNNVSMTSIVRKMLNQKYLGLSEEEEIKN